MANLTTREFWAATGDRAIKTVAQTGLALAPATFIANEAGIIDFNGIPWAGLAATALFAGAISVLTSIVGDTVGKNGPSFVHAEGIGIENAEAEEALRRQRAGEVIDLSTEVSFATDASAGEDEEDDHLDDDEADDLEPAEEDLEALANSEVDDTPPAEGYRPRH
ncbi:holin [Brevibacterium permense]|uniref:Holin n=1 Tax=Brevibacterium permense TaxID=234834 RepID=A0ABN2A9V3_9MICO|nr:holin [Brevibacterium permense]